MGYYDNLSELHEKSPRGPQSLRDYREAKENAKKTVLIARTVPASETPDGPHEPDTSRTPEPFEPS